MFQGYEFVITGPASFILWLYADIDVIDMLPRLLRNCTGVVDARAIWPANAPFPYDAYVEVTCTHAVAAENVKRMLKVMAKGGVE